MTRSILLAVPLVIASSAFAQEAGLNALGDERVLAELASRNLETLLDYSFDRLDVPEEQRQTYTVTVALSRLRDEAASLSPNERRRAIQNVVDGIGAILPTVNDPQLLAEQGNILVTQGVLDDATDLENWGANATLQQRLRPTVQTAIDLYEKARQISENQLATLENQIDGPNDTVDIQRYQQADSVYRTADYTRQVLDYYLALSMDPADARRRQLAKGVMEYLQPFIGNSQVDQLYYTNLYGKTALLAADDASLSAAADAFDRVLQAPLAPLDEAEKTYLHAQTFQAHYFKTLTLLAQEQVDAAKQQSQLLDEFVEKQLAEDAVSRVYADVLKYRIADAEAKQTGSSEAAQAAIDILANLSQQYPAFSSVVSQQLLSALPESPTEQQLSQYNRLQLNALIDRAIDDYNAALAGEAYSAAELDAGIAAAEKLVADESLQPAQVELAAWRLPLLKAAKGDELGALDAFLAYAERYRNVNAERAEEALRQSETAIARLGRDESIQSEVAAARSRFLPIAVAEPFNWSRFILPYATHLLRYDRVDEAAEVLRRLPSDHEDYDASRYYLLLADSRRLAALPAESPLRAELQADVQQLTATVSRNLREQIANASGDQAKALKSRLAGVRLQAADSALDEQNQPAQAVEVLKGFEQDIAGLPNEQELLGNALFIRFRALSALGEYQRATEELLRYVDQAGPERGVQIVYNFLQTLDEEFNEARRLKQPQQQQSLAEARVALTPQLIRFAEQAGLQTAVYTYKRYDAESRRIAAEVTADPARKQELLEASLQQFAELETPEQERLFKSDLAGSFDKYDPLVTLGIARTLYDLDRMEEANGRFGRLLQDRVLGRPINTVRDAATGSVEQESNANYWEALLKWYRTEQALDRLSDEDLRNLRSVYIRYGDDTGGPEWADAFRQLRQDLLPGFTP